MIFSWFAYHVLFLLAFTILGIHTSTTVLFNSDTLFLQDFAQDVLSGYDPRDWMFPVAPFIFPDALISLPAAAIGWNNPPTYLAIYSYLQLAIAVGGVTLIASSMPSMRRMNRRSRWECSVAVGVGMGAFYWLSVVTYCLLKLQFHTVGYSITSFLLPQMHSGTYAWTLCCYGLYLRWMRSKSTRFGIVPLLIALIAGSAGNALFLTFAIVPIAVSILVSTWLRRCDRQKSWRARWAPLIWVMLAFPIGRGVCSVIPHASLSSQSKTSMQSVGTALDTLVRGFVKALTTLEPTHWIAVLACMAFLMWMITCLRSMSQRIPANLHVTLVFGCAGILTPLALIMGGSNGLSILKDYVWTCKYLTPMLLGPSIFSILIASSWALKGTTRFLTARNDRLRCLASPTSRGNNVFAWLTLQSLSLSLVFIAAGIVASLLACFQVGTFGFRPIMVSRLSVEPELQGVKTLFAGFWPARLIRLYSAQRFDVHACNSDLTPYPSLSNAAKHLAAEDTVDRFAVLVGEDYQAGSGWISQTSTEERFGPPLKVVEIDANWRALVYEPKIAAAKNATIYRVDNPNYGLQSTDRNETFTWIGTAAARFKIYSPIATPCTFSFVGLPGPGLPRSDQGTLRIVFPDGLEKKVILKQIGTKAEIEFFVPKGRSELQISCTDQPKELTGDILGDRQRSKGALMLSISHMELHTLSDVPSELPVSAPTTVRIGQRVAQ